MTAKGHHLLKMSEQDYEVTAYRDARSSVKLVYAALK